MKKLNLKKLTAAVLSLCILLLTTACSSATVGIIGGADGPTAIIVGPDGQSDASPAYKIAIVKQMDHASLDEIAEAVAAQLDSIAAEEGLVITHKIFSGGGDASLLMQIGAQLIAEDYDAIVPIATLAAQQMANAAEETGTPVIFAAVSDPEAAGLTGIDYVTGTSDALNTAFILNMMLVQKPDIQTVGLLYSLSEPNSVLPIAQAKEYLDSKNIAYVEKTGNTNDEIISAVASMLDQVDAVFTPTDNVVMATELAIADTLIEHRIPHYTGADSFVRNGAFATSGVNYTELGAYTARMAVEVLRTGIVPEYHVMEGGIITVNIETAQAMGADYSVFSQLAGQVTQVLTTEQ